MEQSTRYEVNRNVRMVLVRHDVDLSRLDFSYVGNTIYLYGELAKSMEGEFTAGNIESLAKDLSHLQYVRDLQFDVANWVVRSSAGSWQIMRKKRPAASAGMQTGAASTDATVHVKKPDETISDVLKDIRKKDEEKKERSEKS